MLCFFFSPYCNDRNFSLSVARLGAKKQCLEFLAVQTFSKQKNRRVGELQALGMGCLGC